MSSGRSTGHVVDTSGLPLDYPTHLHSAEFWEALGRAVASFGFLEEALAKAIFAFTATREYRDDEIEDAYAKWLATLERALSDQLGGLINTYQKAARDHGSPVIGGFDDLIDDLRKASAIRNVLCHGSWRAPDRFGRSRPFFVNRQGQVFAEDIDIDFLVRVRRSAALLASHVISTVTHMGWQFPGSSGPGVPIMKSSKTK